MTPAPSVTSVSPTTGLTAGGTSVTVTGTDFTGASVVDFGSDAATAFTVNSPTSITATTPAESAGTVDTTVTTPAGTSATSSADQFTFATSLECNPPTITSANSATVVAGTPFSFTVTTCSTAVPTSIKAAGLPKGLVLVYNHNGTGTIQGTASLHDQGVYTATITVAVKGQTSGTQQFTATVDNAPVFKSKAKDLVHTGTLFSYPITTAYGYPIPTLTSSALPSGISLVDNHNGTGSLTGTPAPTTGGVYSITITATNGVGAPVNQTFALTVYQAPTLSAPSSVTVTEGVEMTPVTVDYAGYPSPIVKAAGLPKGLALVNNNNGTATISGIPGSRDLPSYNATVSASSKAGSTNTSIAFTVDG